mmetsp:Transcript_112413/g.210816  ORF Transcript_112413/g.210816 Transcript_112413/m.210816 type:complete len:972 (+) Transcript_112413:77-2992(+)
MADFIASPAARARCEKEMAKPPIEWKTITMDTVNNGHDKKSPGMFYGIEFPWNEAMVHEWGPEWLTKAFHTCETLPADNAVKRIVTEDKIKITTGNNGGKFLFEVEYEKPDPELHTKLFAKVPFPNEGKFKSDRLSSSVNKQPMEYAEIQTSRLMEGYMPMKIPKMYFADISNTTSNWIMITECIKYQFDEVNYGPPGEKKPQLAPFEIEGPYDKCIDAANLRGDAKDYYMIMIKKGAILCGMHKAGKILDDAKLVKSFSSSINLKMSDIPMVPNGISGEPKQQIESKINSGLKFFEQAKVIFPDFVTTDEFKKRFRTAIMTLNAYSMEITWWKEGNKDMVALSHANMNVDNAYFWRDADGNLDCGVLDWGGFGAQSVGHKMWWWLYCMDYEPLKDGVDSLLQCFIDTYHSSGGPKLDMKEFKDMFCVTAMQQMIGLISAVGQINRMCKADNWKTIKDRYDPRIALNIDDKSTLRLYLHVMNNIMRMMMEWDADQALLKGFVEDFYVAKLGKKAKTPVEIGLEEPKKNEDIEMTWDECYEMQDTLIKAYDSTDFQKQLHREWNKAGEDPIAQGKARQAVCLPVQIPVITKYGFSGDRAGVNASQRPFRKFIGDEKLDGQSAQLGMLVTPTAQEPEFLAKHGIVPTVKFKPKDRKGMTRSIPKEMDKANPGLQRVDASGSKAGFASWEDVHAVDIIYSQGKELINLGSNDEAEPYLREALKLYEEVLGEGHMCTCHCANTLGFNLHDQGRYTEGLPLLQSAVAGFTRQCGKGHAHTVAAMNNLALCYQHDEKLEQATATFREALKLSEECRGPVHNQTLSIMSNLAECLRLQREFELAEPLFRQAFQGLANELGPENQNVMLFANNLAVCLRDQGKDDEALALYKLSSEGLSQTYGKDHQKTQIVKKNMEELKSDPAPPPPEPAKMMQTVPRPTSEQPFKGQATVNQCAKSSYSKGGLNAFNRMLKLTVGGM